MLKKITFIFILVATGFVMGNSQEEEILVDFERNVYRIAEFDGTTWMLDNLRSTRTNLGEKVKLFLPNEDEENIKIFGMLYDYKIAQSICPKGWELPSLEDWEKLLSLFDSKASSFRDWDYWPNDTADNKSNFSARPAGYGNQGDHPNLFSEKAIFWTNTSSENLSPVSFAWTVIVEQNEDKLRKAEQHLNYAFSVRCIKK